MPDTRARGLDLSSNNTPPPQIIAAWRSNPGLCFGWYRASIGALRDTLARQHGDALRDAGYVTGCYHALHEAVSAVAQARLFASLQHPGNRLPPMLDVERAALTRAHVLAFVAEWFQVTDLDLGIYTSAKSWHAIVGRDEYAFGDLPVLWVAAYPFDTPAGQPAPMDGVSVARRSTPPVATPPLPAAWPAYDFYQHTGQGSLPGYGAFVDLNVYQGTEAELRTRFGAAPTIETEAAGVLAQADAITSAAGALKGLL